MMPSQTTAMGVINSRLSLNAAQAQTGTHSYPRISETPVRSNIFREILSQVYQVRTRELKRITFATTICTTGVAIYGGLLRSSRAQGR